LKLNDGKHRDSRLGKELPLIMKTRLVEAGAL